jgi:hypothetical protein
VPADVARRDELPLRNMILKESNQKDRGEYTPSLPVWKTRKSDEAKDQEEELNECGVDTIPRYGAGDPSTILPYE